MRSRSHRTLCVHLGELSSLVCAICSYVRQDGDDEYRIVFRTTQRRVHDAQGVSHDVVDNVGQWVIYHSTTAETGKRHTPRFLYAVTSAWPVPPPVGWMAVKGRRPLPRLEALPSPHPCDRTALDLEQCGSSTETHKCVQDARAALHACVVEHGFLAPAGGTRSVHRDNMRPPLPLAVSQDLGDGDRLRMKSYEQSGDVPATNTVLAQRNEAGGLSTTGSGAAGPSSNPAPEHGFEPASSVVCGQAAMYKHRPVPRWCSCTDCGVRGGRVLLFMPNSTLPAPASFMTAAASHYQHPYFTTNDRVFATVVPRRVLPTVECDDVVEAPSFFFAARRLHNLYVAGGSVCSA